MFKKKKKEEITKENNKSTNLEGRLEMSSGCLEDCVHIHIY